MMDPECASRVSLTNVEEINKMRERISEHSSSCFSQSKGVRRATFHVHVQLQVEVLNINIQRERVNRYSGGT